jgi:D-sedoheptulose 7-phosphate isomerase
VEATDDYVATVLADAIAVHRQFATADLQPVYGAAAMIVEALGAGGKLLVLGNGGSAADAQHVAAELVGRFERARRPLAALALTADSSVVTSVANDEGYAEVFVRQVEALGRAGDVVLAISTSGRSPNVVAALKTARELGLRTIALTGGDGGDAGLLGDVHVNVPAESTARVQEVHRTLLHAICGLVEQAVR